MRLASTVSTKRTPLWLRIFPGSEGPSQHAPGSRERQTFLDRVDSYWKHKVQLKTENPFLCGQEGRDSDIPTKSHPFPIPPGRSTPSSPTLPGGGGSHKRQDLYLVSSVDKNPSFTITNLKTPNSSVNQYFRLKCPMSFCQQRGPTTISRSPRH